MALPLAEAFTARSLGVMWDNYKKTLGTEPYLGRLKFGTRKQDSLDLRFIKGKSGLPVSLKASNFDAQAELRDVGGFSDIQNEMPFYRESLHGNRERGAGVRKLSKCRKFKPCQ